MKIIQYLKVLLWITLYPYGYLHISDNGASVRAQGLSPLKPQRGRMD